MGWYIVYETPERLLDFTRREHREEGGKAEPYQTMSQDGVLSVDGMGGAETLVGISARTIPLAVTTSVPEVSAPHDAMGPSPARARVAAGAASAAYCTSSCSHGGAPSPSKEETLGEGPPSERRPLGNSSGLRHER